MSTNQSVGEALVHYLETKEVEIVFGIPGVHTVEMYRGLGTSSIRHVTPRHEQGAGFMADGYARASGKIGVTFIITGPGLTNILTPMAQARADSIPMLVVSSVNEEKTIGRGYGHLHELPDQHGLVSKVALKSEHVSNSTDLIPSLDALFSNIGVSRPGPLHVQVPLDVFGKVFDRSHPAVYKNNRLPIDDKAIQSARARLADAKHPVIIVGGGAINAEHHITRLAEKLDAPIIQTINARGMFFNHALSVPACPSLDAIKKLITEADCILAVGTEIGATDFDIYNTGSFPKMENMIRIDVDPEGLKRHQSEVVICGMAENIVPLVASDMEQKSSLGTERAFQSRKAAKDELSPKYRDMIKMVEAIRDTLPGSIIVGDSTQFIYAANMYYAHDNPRGWFGSATGYGTLGYAIPAAIGAALGAPNSPVVAIMGDGGAQFTLPELMTAVDEQVNVVFLVYNNFAYGEIATSMEAKDVKVVGCHPKPPNFQGIADANYMPFVSCENTPEALAAALLENSDRTGPMMIEIQV
jgi:acetolactate synthase-1/2/3 large subunit